MRLSFPITFRLGAAVLLAAVPGFCLLASQTGPPAARRNVRTVTVSEANAGKVAMTVGQRLVVRLASNASTGYSWKVSNKNPKVLPAVGKPGFVQSGGNAPGSGGTAFYMYSAAKAGSAVLVFAYARSWEKVPPAKTVKFIVHISKPKARSR